MKLFDVDTYRTKGAADYCLEGAPLEGRNYILACFIVSLIQGDTILGGSLRHSSLRGYQAAVCALHAARGLPSPLSVDVDLVAPLLQTVRNYEAVPNRRDMITDAMISYMLVYTERMPLDCLERAIMDWIILGRYTGFRQAEWCQTSQTVATTVPSIALPSPQPLACCPCDLVFFDAKDCPTAHTLNAPDAVEVTWRYQKNNNNMERIPFRRDHDNPSVCPVLAAERIQQRALRLGVPPSSPAAVFCNPKSASGFSYITATKTTQFLRASCKATYNLQDTDARISRLSCHSIRVTAANLLHRACMSDSYIQTRLRWKSTTFLMYLRNTFYAADQHTAAMKISNRNLPTLTTSNGEPPWKLMKIRGRLHSFTTSI
jgi:hypothetical protein